MRLVIFSAFPQELKPLLRKLKIIRSLRHNFFSVFFSHNRSHEIILVRTGMGASNQEKALEYIIEEHRPDCICSIGFGGALYENAKIGELVWGTKLLLLPEDAKKATINTGGRQTDYLLNLPDRRDIFDRLHQKINIQRGSIITLAKPMKKSVIKRLITDELSFPVCDMETFYLSKYSSHKGLAFISIRAVTDRLNETIPLELFKIVDESGNYSLARALKLLIFKPGLILHAIKLGKHADIAANNLSQAVTGLIDILPNT